MSEAITIGSRSGAAALSKQTARAYMAEVDTAPGFWMIGILWRMLATGVQTGNAMCLLDQSCGKGSGPARHAHPQEEGLYVAKGRASFQAGGMKFKAEAGCLVTVPRHTEHSFVLDEDSTLINFYFPAGFDLWLMGSAVPAQRKELPPKDLAPPVYEHTKRLSDDYGGLPLTTERSTSANPDAPALPTVTRREIADTYWYDRGCWSILADGSATGGSYCVFEVEQPVGSGRQPRICSLSDEAFYILDGNVLFAVDDQVFDARGSSFVFVPRGSVHSFEVKSATARFLNIHTEPGYERVLRAFGERVKKFALPPANWQGRTAPPERWNSITADIGLRTVMIPTRTAESARD